MSKVAEVIDNIRQELSDEQSTRWSDAQLIRFIQQAVTRSQHVGRRNNLQFLKDKEDFVFLAGESSKPLPNDFMVDIGVWNLGLPGTSLAKVDEETWENSTSPNEASQYMIEGANLVIQGVPTADTTLRLRFFKGCSLASLLLDAADMPWSGQLDSIIEGYAALRARNVDRDSTQADFELLQDLENNILNTLGSQSVNVVRSRGWLI
ncbi:hypothetical protein [Desulfovibrio gilichinskyi]|uniref:Uncharacterized protein n=1 Tax=Desulfovibrio gilichinskyi TaxID=1519643 RepID=A0A1X7C3J0_9BACT|nr:hypothetical protein [Desulfovibrio gilichinskyi]SME89413.1 hypothetical protein SAMN06295933_0296 [Desulfovibrio gilichinskyi]